MIELVKLAINKPSHAILVALSIMVVYLGTGQVGIKEALAGITAKQETYSITEQRVYETNEAVSRIETQINFVAMEIDAIKENNQ